MKENHEIEISIALVKAEDLPETPITLTREQQDRIFEACFCTEEMRDYYKTRELDDHQIRDLICGAPRSLKQKVELMEPHKDNPWFKKMYEQTKLAIDELTLGENEVFILSEYSYWDRINFKILKHKNLFSSNEILAEYLQLNEDERNSRAEADEYWEVLEKWHFRENGYGDILYTYYFLEGVPMYFTKHGEPGEDFCRNSISPYISIPFKKGDMVYVDCYPFAPIKVAVLLEDGFNKDGRNKCCTSILYQMHDGSWMSGDIFHGVWKPHYPELSPLYRLKTFDDILGEDEDFLLTVQKFVRGNNKNGEKLSRKLYMTHKGKLYYDGASKEKVLEYMKEIEFENEHGKRGVFWVIDGELLAYPFDGRIPEAIAKSGNTYNHKLLWESEKPKNKPFDYYPRGRVDINSKGEAVIYMNPNIGEEFIPEIKTAFGITAEPVIKYDNSEHYKCYLDR